MQPYWFTRHEDDLTFHRPTFKLHDAPFVAPTQTAPCPVNPAHLLAQAHNIIYTTRQELVQGIEQNAVLHPDTAPAHTNTTPTLHMEQLTPTLTAIRTILTSLPDTLPHSPKQTPPKRTPRNNTPHSVPLISTQSTPPHPRLKSPYTTHHSKFNTMTHTTHSLNTVNALATH